MTYQNKIINQDEIKRDSGKSRVDLIEPEFILGIGSVMEYGLKKYPQNAWKKIEDKHNRNYASVLRHLLAWKSGEQNDTESGQSHLLHAAYNLMVLYYDDLHGEDK